MCLELLLNRDLPLIFYYANIPTNNMENITKEQFEAFEQVRLSGKTNMFDYRTVAKLGKIRQKTVKKIITNYLRLKFKFKGNEEEKSAR